MKNRRWAALVAATCLALGACAAETPPSETKPESGAPSSPGSPPSPAAQVDTSMVTSGAAGTLTHDAVKATTLPLADFPALAMAQENLRSQVLRRAAWQGSSPVEITPSINSANKDAISLLVTVKDGEHTHYSTIAYDTASNRAFNSAALIEPAKWSDFVAAVAAADGGAEIASTLTADVYPLGEAPALGFTADGGLLVIGAQTVGLDPEKTTPLLTKLGRAVQNGARQPEKVTARTKFESPAPDLTGSDSAKPDISSPSTQPMGEQGSDSPSAKESESGQRSSERPRISLGPDCEKLKCVALTFDDGPVAETKNLLDVLRSKKAPATFFTLGNNVKLHPEIVKLAAAQGHQVGWHTVTHPELPRVSADRVQREIDAGPTTLSEIVGSTPLVFRPPYGAHNPKVDAVIGANKMINVMWSVDTQDWNKTRVQGDALTQSVVNIALSQSKPGGIILVHDIHSTSRAAAGPIVDGLTKQGFTLVTVTELPGWQEFSWGSTHCAGPSFKATCF